MSRWNDTAVWYLRRQGSSKQRHAARKTSSLNVAACYVGVLLCTVSSISLKDEQRGGRPICHLASGSWAKRVAVREASAMAANTINTSLLVPHLPRVGRGRHTRSRKLAGTCRSPAGRVSEARPSNTSSKQPQQRHQHTQKFEIPLVLYASGIVVSYVGDTI